MDIDGGGWIRLFLFLVGQGVIAFIAVYRFTTVLERRLSKIEQDSALTKQLVMNIQSTILSDLKERVIRLENKQK